MPPGIGVRVMCVDDYPDVVNTLTALFELSGIEARGFLDGASALAVAAEFRPHVCIVDINMPVMDGYQLALRLREVLGPTIRLIALSAAISDEFSDRAMKLGFDLAFTKPPDMDRLLGEIHRAADPRV